MALNMKALIGKLNPTAKSAMEAAAGLCLARTHYDIEIEHYLMKLLDISDSDATRIFKQFGVDTSRLGKELTRSLDKFKAGNGRGPALAPSLLEMIREGWTIGSIDYGASEVRTGHTLLALTSDEKLARMVREVSKEFQKIEPELLRKDFLAIVKGTQEDDEYAEAPRGSDGAAAEPRKGGKTTNLDQFTVNLTENAKKGKIDPVLGRDTEIRQVVDILMRRRQNNPILTGEAGVGKTAVVEGFALRIAHGDVPPPLKNVVLRTLDLALLQAGAGVKGEFENRLKGLIEEVKSSPVPIILFIDEAHTMIGAGGQAGQNDAANLLKPALARGELRTIAATTWSEYKKYFEKDPALARRFQVVKVEEPTEAQCMVMMRGIVGSLEKHHDVRILDEGVEAAVRLSHRYLAGRQLPDKAVSILDTACARLALGHNSIPAALEEASRRIDDLTVQDRVLRREAATGADHEERLADIASQKRETEERLAKLRERFDKERQIVGCIRELRGKLETHEGTADEAEPLRAELAKLNKELDQLQGETPMMRVAVDSQIVGNVISAWTGIPVGNMLKDEVSTVLALEKHLGGRVIGQD
ncbi:MAG TPA: AAA family ATPase, partial [Bryobacteraceae bacterium]|nr:AAA family ATPase [Bryobacteraceae bacterium]